MPTTSARDAPKLNPFKCTTENPVTRGGLFVRGSAVAATAAVEEAALVVVSEEEEDAEEVVSSKFAGTAALCTAHVDAM